MLCQEHGIRPKHSHTFTPTLQGSIFLLFPNRVHGFSLSTGTRLCSSYRAGPRTSQKISGPVNDRAAMKSWKSFCVEKLEWKWIDMKCLWFVVCGFVGSVHKGDRNLTPKGDKPINIFCYLFLPFFLWICLGVHHPVTYCGTMQFEGNYVAAASFKSIWISIIDKPTEFDTEVPSKFAFSQVVSEWLSKMSNCTKPCKSIRDS